MKRFFSILFLGFWGIAQFSFAQTNNTAVTVGTIKNQIDLIVKQIDNIDLSVTWPQVDKQDAKVVGCTVPTEASLTSAQITRYFPSVSFSIGNNSKLDSLWIHEFSIKIQGVPVKTRFDTANEGFKASIPFSVSSQAFSGGYGSSQIVHIPTYTNGTVLRNYCGRINANVESYNTVGNYLEGLGQGLKGVYKPSDSTWKWLLHIGWKDVGGTKEILGDLKTAIEGQGQVHDAFINQDGSAKPTMQRLSKLLDDLKGNLSSIETWKGKASEGINFDNVGKWAENTKNTANNTNQITAALKNILRNPTEVDRYLAAAEQNMQQLTQSIQQISQLILSITPGSIEVSIEKQPIAVMPVGIFGSEANPEGYKKIGPDTIAERLRVFIQDQLAPPLFVLMVVLGGVFYLFVPFNQANINKGKDYVKFAIWGYLIILVASAILTLTRGFFGNP